MKSMDDTAVSILIFFFVTVFKLLFVFLLSYSF